MILSVMFFVFFFVKVYDILKSCKASIVASRLMKFSKPGKFTYKVELTMTPLTKKNPLFLDLLVANYFCCKIGYICLLLKCKSF